MALTDEQKQSVAAWIEQGARPADVQARLEKEFDIRMTYMEVRFLIDDLKVMPKDATPPEAPKAEATPADAPASESPDQNAPVGGGKVSVTVDEITKPGVMMSGRATFTDGKSVEWYLDQYGRLGMVPPEPGYRPAQEDLMEFQAALERELAKFGM